MSEVMSDLITTKIQPKFICSGLGQIKFLLNTLSGNCFVFIF